MSLLYILVLIISFSTTYGQKINNTYLNSNVSSVTNTGAASHYELCNSFERTNKVPSQGCYDYLDTNYGTTNGLHCYILYW